MYMDIRVLDLVCTCYILLHCHSAVQMPKLKGEEVLSAPFPFGYVTCSSWVTSKPSEQSAIDSNTVDAQLDSTLPARQPQRSRHILLIGHCAFSKTNEDIFNSLKAICGKWACSYDRSCKVRFQVICAASILGSST